MISFLFIVFLLFISACSCAILIGFVRNQADWEYMAFMVFVFLSSLIGALCLIF